jgi:hypothetical protein
MNKLTIAIDYDDTYTADPVFWNRVIQLAKEHNHNMICVTARSHENRQELINSLPEGMTTYFSHDEPKADYIKRQNIVVDIWIDDSPGWIVGIT